MKTSPLSGLWGALGCGGRRGKGGCTLCMVTTADRCKVLTTCQALC